VTLHLVAFNVGACGQVSAVLSADSASLQPTMYVCLIEAGPTWPA
jgi:hypothetical protein